MTEKKESETYRKMLEEAERIVRDVADSDQDLDLLTDKVKRGYALVRKMKERLEVTKEHLDKLRAEFETSSKE